MPVKFWFALQCGCVGFLDMIEKCFEYGVWFAHIPTTKYCILIILPGHQYVSINVSYQMVCWHQYLVELIKTIVTLKWEALMFYNASSIHLKETPCSDHHSYSKNNIATFTTFLNTNFAGYVRSPIKGHGNKAVQSPVSRCCKDT